MLFKRFIEGKSMLNEGAKAQEKCSRRRSQCDNCGCEEHSAILEETMKMVLLGVVLWAGVTFGSHVAPYPFNLIFSSDIIHPPPMYDFPFPSAQVLKSLPPITAAHTNKSIAFGKMSVSMLKRLEENLGAAGISPKSGSAAQGLLIHGYPSEDAMHYEQSSLTITKASRNLVDTRCTIYGLQDDECASFISTLNLRGSEYGGECAALERFTCGSNKMSSKYRMFDGSCNNPVRSSWGQTLTGYKRLLHPRYDDGIDKPRRAVSRRPLPSARLVSTKLVNNVDRPSDKKTIAVAVFSQFVYHDMVYTPVTKMIHTNKAIRCCHVDGYDLIPRYVHPSCMPIQVPSDDLHFKSKYVSCMEYTRSVTTYRGDCTFGAAEQMNQATHFLDGSQIYGTNSREAAALRETSGGLLKTSLVDGEEYMPLAANPAERCMVSGNSATCFSAGDIRANMHPWLASLHSLWLREHNRVARSLATLNPTWNNDKLYHEARRIVIAELQHITYKYWVPAVLGKPFDELFESYDSGYNSDVDSTVTNAFATVAFHFVNSLLDKDLEIHDGGNVTSSYRLKNYYFNPELVTRRGGLDQLLRGMVTEKSQRMDLNYEDDVWHHWLGGLDALAIDIQRSRDHGLPGYVQFRSLCGFSPATDFQQLSDFIPQETVDKLEKIYGHPNDIDLVVGAMAEEPLSGSLLGPTFVCLIKEQLLRTRVGDRYFYSHTDESGSFTKRQLIELRRSSLERLLCDNTGISTMQRDVFQPPSESNPMVSCDEVKRVNLEAWQEAGQKPDILSRTTNWIKNRVVGDKNGNLTK